MNLRVFAFGINEIDGCLCPATAAGFDPGTTIAGLYDMTASGTGGSGVISEMTARTAWLTAIKEEARWQIQRYGWHAAFRAALRGAPGVDPYVGASVRVAKVLGWLGAAWDARLRRPE